jgi:CO dehydrogenase nickel-insertion accessory protein CooC1
MASSRQLQKLTDSIYSLWAGPKDPIAIVQSIICSGSFSINLSRRTTNNVDLLCIVAEPTPLGTETAKRIHELAKSLPISVKQIGIIWNRSDNINNLKGIESFGFIPYDKAVLDASMQNKTAFDLEENGSAISAASKILGNILNKNNVSITQN